MEQITLLFLVTFVSPAYLQVINDANYYPVLKDNVNLGPVAHKPYWPVQTYETFRGNFYGLAQKGTIPKACTRPSSIPNAAVELTTNTPLLPARRLFYSDNERPESANIQSNILKVDDETLTPTSDKDDTLVLTNNRDNTPIQEMDNDDNVFETKKEEPKVFEDQTEQTESEDPSNQVLASPTFVDEPQAEQSKSNKCTKDLENGRWSLQTPDSFLTESENNVNHERMFTNIDNTRNTQLRALGGRDTPYYPKTINNGIPSNEISQSANLGTALEYKNAPWDPTQGAGISKVTKANLRSIDSDRICFACSSSNNPTCLAPNRRTTIKYCRRGVNACVTKIFGTDELPILIRDCANSCDNSDIPGLVPKYKKCSICHSDLCNGASNIALNFTSLSVLLIITLQSFNYGK